MPLIKISKQYVVSQDEESITINVPADLVTLWKRDYEKVAIAKGILKQKRDAMLAHLSAIRQEWDK